jgi:Holliday junction resolvase RusA-like endonuclease
MIADRAPDLIISIPGPFRGKGRHRTRVHHSGGRIFARQHADPATAQYEGILRHFGHQAMKAAGIFTPFECPCWARVTATWTPPASWSGKKRQRAIAGEVEHVVKPDGDNIGKIIGDGFNKIIWADDSQVSRWEILKQYGEAEGLHVEIWRR